VFEEIFQVWKNELEEADVVRVEEGFWNAAQKYVERLRLTLNQSNGESLQFGLAQLELQKVKFMIKDIILSRREKIITALARGKTEANRLSPLENEIAKGMITSFEEFEEFIDASLKGQQYAFKVEGGKMKSSSPVQEGVGKPQYLFVRFKTDLPQIIGVDSKTYGPFSTEDVAALPEANARPLIERGVVQKIE